MSNLPKIENVTLQILRMGESSGNIQIFVRAKRTDDNSSNLFQETLECILNNKLDKNNKLISFFSKCFN